MRPEEWGERLPDGLDLSYTPIVRGEVSDKDWTFLNEEFGEGYRWEYDD